MRHDDGAVLVTGASGFIGSYLCDLLEGQGRSVIRAAPNPRSGETNTARFELNDVGGMTAVLRGYSPTKIVHLAGISTNFGTNASAIYLTNVVGTVNLMTSIQAANLQLDNFVALSSASIYGDSGGPRTDEACTPKPGSDYAISKLAMEFILRRWSYEMPITVVRLFNCTGVRQPFSFVIPKIVRHFAVRAATLTLGNTTVVREYNDVRRVVSIIADLLDRPRSYNILNVCSGKGYSLNDVINVLSRLSDHCLQIQKDPQLFRRSEPAILVGDPSRLHAVIGSTPFPPLEETLCWMLSEAEF